MSTNCISSVCFCFENLDRHAAVNVGYLQRLFASDPSCVCCKTGRTFRSNWTFVCFYLWHQFIPEEKHNKEVNKKPVCWCCRGVSFFQLQLQGSKWLAWVEDKDGLQEVSAAKMMLTGLVSTLELLQLFSQNLKHVLAFTTDQFCNDVTHHTLASVWLLHTHRSKHLQSAVMVVIKGVPQGFVLGPLLFTGVSEWLVFLFCFLKKAI